MTHGNSFLSQTVKSSTLTHLRKDDTLQGEGLTCPEEKDLEEPIGSGVSRGGVGAKSQKHKKSITGDEMGSMVPSPCRLNQWFSTGGNSILSGT